MVTTNNELNALFTGTQFQKSNFNTASSLQEAKGILEEQIGLLVSDGSHSALLGTVRHRLSGVESRLSGSFFAGSLKTLSPGVTYTAVDNSDFDISGQIMDWLKKLFAIILGFFGLSTILSANKSKEVKELKKIIKETKTKEKKVAKEIEKLQDDKQANKKDITKY